jgi:anti-sigma B factor antagonist
MQEAGFPIEVIEGVAVVATPEEVDVTNAAGLQTALRRAADDGHTRLVVDMSGTRFCDSFGIQALAAAQQSALAEDRLLVLAVPGPAVMRALELTGINEIIPSFASLEEALRHAAARGPQAPGS